MKGHVLFMDCISADYVPLIVKIAEQGFTPIMNQPATRAQVEAQGVACQAFEAFITPDSAAALNG